MIDLWMVKVYNRQRNAVTEMHLHQVPIISVAAFFFMEDEWKVTKE